MNFGENLKSLRKSKKLSQEDLAEKVGVSRQSVSKWENSESYPEMNNILELCKIFKCHINDLVNDSIIDIESLDEEIKINVVKFKREQQNKMKSLSNAIYIISKISRIIVMICIPIVASLMLILLFIITKTKISENKITFDGISDEITFEENDGSTLVKLNGVEVDNETKIVALKIKAIFLDNSKGLIIGYVVTGFLCLTICLILISIMLKHLESLFYNINQGDTPFTLDNVNHIKSLAYLMIVVIILPNVCGIIFNFILKNDISDGFEMFDLIEILFLFSMAYIFQYGYEIQLDSKGKMYGDQNE